MAEPYVPPDGIHCTKLYRWGGCPSDIVIWRLFSFRAELDAWVAGADSKANQEFRVRCLEEAFGLRSGYIMGRGSLGPGLQQRILDWMEDHPDLELNRPGFERSFLADLGDLG